MRDESRPLDGLRDPHQDPGGLWDSLHDPAGLRSRAAGEVGRVPLLIATGFGVGFSRWAPGTCGSLLGLAAFLGLSQLGLIPFVATLVALTALGVWAADIVEAASGHEDDQRIVIDEIVGQLWLLLPLLMWMPGRGLGADLVFSLLLVTAFVLCRVLDIVKPGPVGWAERRFEGGLGVMADDLVAGGIGAVMLALLLQLLMALGVVTQAMPGPQRWWWGWAA